MSVHTDADAMILKPYPNTISSSIDITDNVGFNPLYLSLKTTASEKYNLLTARAVVHYGCVLAIL
jgi:hypothetical protein